MVIPSTGDCLIVSMAALRRVPNQTVNLTLVEERIGDVHDRNETLLVYGPLPDFDNAIDQLEAWGLSYFEDFIHMEDGNGHIPDNWEFRLTVRGETDAAESVVVGPGVSVVVRKRQPRSLNENIMKRIRDVGDIVDESSELLVLGPFYERATPADALDAMGLKMGEDFFCLDYSGGALPDWCTYRIGQPFPP